MLGIGLMVVGALLVGLGLFGNIVIEDSTSNTYVDPRVPVSLPPGRYPLEWLGPGKGPRPFVSDLDIEVRSRPAGARWEPPGVETIIPTGSYYEDMGRSSLGAIDVDQPSLVSVRFNPSVPTEGGPRMKLPGAAEPPRRTRAGLLTALGLASGAVGLFLLSWSRRR